MADDTSGKIKHVGGKIEEKIGDVLGDSRMQRSGRLTQVEGEAEQDQAHHQDQAEDAAVRKQAARTAKKENR